MMLIEELLTKYFDPRFLSAYFEINLNLGMEDFPRTKTCQFKKPISKPIEQKPTSTRHDKYDKEVVGGLCQVPNTKSYLLLEENDKENKRNVSNLMIDSSSGAIKYKGSVLTEHARLKTLPLKTAPKTQQVAQGTSKTKNQNAVSNYSQGGDVFKHDKDPNPSKSVIAADAKIKRRTVYEQLTPTGARDKSNFNSRSPSNAFSILDSGTHYTASFYTKMPKGIREQDTLKNSKNKSYGCIGQSKQDLQADSTSRNPTGNKRECQDTKLKSDDMKSESRRHLSLSSSKQVKLNSAAKVTPGRGPLKDNEVNLYETGSQTQIKRFELEDTTSDKKRNERQSKAQGFFLDSLKKVVIDDSGLKRKRSQLRIDDLQEMFEGDKKFIESTKKVKERLESSNKKSSENRIIDYEPFQGKKLNFNEEFTNQDIFQTEIQNNDGNTQDDVKGSTLPKAISYDKLKAQKRPLNSVDFISIKNNLKLKRLVSQDPTPGFSSPKKNLPNKEDGAEFLSSAAKIENLFSNHSVKKFGPYDQSNSRGRNGEIGDLEEENIFNKTSDAKFTFTEFASDKISPLGIEKRNRNEIKKESMTGLNNFKKKAFSQINQEKLSLLKETKTPKLALKDNHKKIFKLLSTIHSSISRQDLTLEPLREYLTLIEPQLMYYEQSVVCLGKASGLERSNRLLANRAIKMECLAIITVYHILTKVPPEDHNLIRMYLVDLTEKLLKNNKFFLKATQLSNSLSDTEEGFSVDDLFDMLEFTSSRIQSVLTKMYNILTQI